MIVTTVPVLPRRRWFAAPARYDRPAEVLAVLQHARAAVEAGWVQDRWTGTGGSCLVGAVALAVRDRDPRADLAIGTGPALAFVHDAVFSQNAMSSRIAGRSAPHHVRVQRMRELARWNDVPGRTRDDIVSALDRAAAAVVARVVEPAR
jgi:hypothetical protein